MLYLNIQGLLKGKDENKDRKIKYLSEYCKTENVKLLIITESHLNPDILDEEVEISNFNIHRSDRVGRHCGGVAIYTHENLQVQLSKVRRFSNSHCELLMLNIESLNLHIICVYRPPDSTSDLFNPCLSEIQSYLEQVPINDSVHIIGDINLPFLKWREVDGTVIYQVTSGSTRDEQSQASALLDLTDKHFLNQIITEPTRIKNTIDLVFTNDTDIICNHKVEKVSKHLSDHNQIIADLTCKNSYQNQHKKNQKTDKLRVFNFWSGKAKWDEMNKYLQNLQWEQTLNSESNVQNDTDYLYDAIYTASCKFIPTKKSTNYKGIPPDRRKLFRRSKFLKRKLLNTSKKSKVKNINEEIIDIQTKLLQSHEAERLKKETDLVKGIKKNTKLFFAYAKKNKKTKDTIGPLKNEAGNIVSDPKKMCEIIKSQYEKSFNTRKNDIEVCLETPGEYEINLSKLFNEGDDSPFTNIDITTEDILHAIKSTKINSAPGPDTIPPILLHKCAETLVTPLKIIMKKSLANSDIPSSWKESVITPIYKRKGNKSDPSQYRPISLTSQIIKLLERIIRIYLIQYLEMNGSLPDSQHGFRPSRSTVSQLLEQYERILEALASKHNMDIIMLDYAKAFDKINHSILLFKLKKLGISGNIGRWIGNFLLNRTQRVTVDGHLSTPSAVTSGVPQGTILGPVLFLVYIADIGDNLKKSTIASYADDSKVHIIIKEIKDGLDLQIDVETLYNWTTKNLMEFNTTKFEVLKIGDNKDLKESIVYKTPEGEIIPETELTTDLGLNFNNKGNFGDHIQIKTSKAKQMSGYILRTFVIRNPQPMLTLFKSLVLPHIEYCCIIWNPHTQKEINLLESVQRHYTCKLEGMEECDYYQRLKVLNMYSTERRRDRYLLLYIFKIIFCKVPNPGLSYKWTLRRGKVLTTPPVFTSRGSRGATLLHNSFTRRAPRLFNALPKELRNLPEETNLDVVKRKLDKFLKDVKDEPRIPGYYQTNSAASNRVEDQILVMECLRKDHL